MFTLTKVLGALLTPLSSERAFHEYLGLAWAGLRGWTG